MKLTRFDCLFFIWAVFEQRSLSKLSLHFILQKPGRCDRCRQREPQPALQSRRSEQKDDQLRAVQSREGNQLQVAVIGFSGCFLALPPVGGKFTEDGCAAPLADSEGAPVSL